MGIEERLSRLERENRTLKRGFLALALGAVALVLMGQAAPRPPQPAPIPPFLRIKRLEIIGDNGVPVVILGQHKSFGHVAVANPLGRALVSLGTTRSGKGFVSTYDGGDTRLASIGASAQGAGVVTTRADVHYVVTEYGVARLFGASLQRRAEMLIQLAHPAFRDELGREAKERFKI